MARKGKLEPDFAYTAGLLHDLGRLAMMRAWLPRYAALLDTANPDPNALLALELREFGIRHTRAGSVLIREWKLPDVFAEIANYHHAPQVPEQANVAALVGFACSLANAVGWRHASAWQATSACGWRRASMNWKAVSSSSSKLAAFLGWATLVIVKECRKNGWATAIGH